ncbi:MAG: AAA family ATPase [Leptospiraceae bacterium]|nr:AAA family ATPase [Leptospiraceae bacterium]
MFSKRELAYIQNAIRVYIQNAAKIADSRLLDDYGILVNVYEGFDISIQKEFNKEIQKFLKSFQKEEKKEKDDKESYVNSFRRRYMSGRYDDEEEILKNFKDYRTDYKKVEDFVSELSYNHQKKFIQIFLFFIQKSIDSQKTLSEEELRLQKKIDDISKFLNLDEVEKEILIFTYYLMSNSVINNLFKMLVDGIENIGIIKAISTLLGIVESKIKLTLQKKGKLLFYDIIEIDRDEINLNDEIYDFLEDLDSLDFTDRFFSVIDPTDPVQKEEILDINLFSFYKDKIKIIENMLKSEGKANIIFYGKAGTGKTSLAKSIIKNLNKKIVYVSNRSSYFSGYLSSKKIRDDTSGNRVINLIMACNYAKDNDGIVIMDEADEFLNTHFSIFDVFLSSRRNHNIQKSWLNDFLDKSEYKIIWIANYTDLMDESVKRRFDYSVHFSVFNGETREYIVEQILKKLNLDERISFHDLREYFTDTTIPVGMIETALRQVRNIISINPDISKQEIIQTAREIFDSNYEFVYNKNFPSASKRLHQNYNIGYVNTSPPVNQILDRIKNFARSNVNKTKSFNILFYGPPGSGKTELAKYIANVLNYKVIEITPQNILNPFFGVTEKLIHYYFKQASLGNTVLIIDEIDTFFSGNKYENDIHSTIINQFLQAIDQYKGILIATTNHIDKLFVKIKRRFHMKVEFFSIKKQMIPQVFLDFFKEQLTNPNLTPEQEEILKDLGDVYISDFIMVKSQIEHDGEFFFEEIYKLLKDEVYYRLHQKN